MRITRKGYYTISKDSVLLTKADGKLLQVTSRDEAYERITEDNRDGLYTIHCPNRDVMLSVSEPTPEPTPDPDPDPEQGDADFFVDSSASNDSGAGTAISPKKYINSGISLASPGEIIELANGVYPIHDRNVIDDDILVANPGNSANYIIVRAETDGGVEINADLGSSDSSGNSYYEFHGIKWKNSTSKGLGVSFVKYFRCAFEGGAPDGNVQQTTVSDFQLMEDCWFYGSGGRINLLMYNASNIVLRRCFLRHDGGWGFGFNEKAEPELTCSVYPNGGNPNANILLQNCIVVDSDSFDPPAQIEWAPNFTNNTHGSGASNSFHRGCIVINSKGTAFGIEGSGSFGYLEYTNNASVNNEAGFISNISLAANPLFDGNISINSGAGVANFSNGQLLMENGIVADNANWGFGNGGITADFNNCFNNGPGGSSGCGTNPQTYDPQLNGLKYPVRIETGGALLTDGKSGGQIGATIMKKLGISGTLYGESGYDALTNDDLWPFPNEARIKADMESVVAVPGQVFTGARGFAATGNDAFGRPNSLSRYIWQILGNEVPGEFNLRD